nr:XRE family transcriptional regulator [Paraburkholderia caribensis]
MRERREAAGLSMQALAERVGVRAWQTVQQWEREPGGTAPRRERLRAVADALKTTPEYLLFGQSASDRKRGQSSDSTEPDALRAEEVSVLPVDTSRARPVFVVEMSRQSAGEKKQDAGYSEPLSAVSYAHIATEDPAAFVVPITDSSMYPRYKPGEGVLIEPGEKCEVGDDVFVQLRSGAQMVRQLTLRSDVALELTAYNSPEHTPTRIPVEDVQFVYYVGHAVPARRIRQLR